MQLLAVSWQKLLTARVAEETVAVSFKGVTRGVSRQSHKERKNMALGQHQPSNSNGANGANGANDGTAAIRRAVASDESARSAFSAFRSTEGGSHEAQLTQFIRKQIIPRLAVAHGVLHSVDASAAVSNRAPQEALKALADLAMHEDASAIVNYVEGLVGHGVPIEEVYLEWLAPAARQMGCEWEADEVDFSLVTIGMWKIQQALHALSPMFLKDTAVTKGPRRVLLASVPSEQHTMGLFMVSEFFRRAGWDVWSELPSDYEDVIGKARGEWFDLIGLSVGCDHQVEPMARAIATLRRASRNSDALIMLGGPVLTSNPEITVAVGADFSAIDARDAVARAEQFVASRLSEQFRR